MTSLWTCSWEVAKLNTKHRQAVCLKDSYIPTMMTPFLCLCGYLKEFRCVWREQLLIPCQCYPPSNSFCSSNLHYNLLTTVIKHFLVAGTFLGILQISSSYDIFVPT